MQKLRGEIAMKKSRLFFLFLVIVLLVYPVKQTYGVGKVALSSTKLTITEGTSKQLKLKNNKKKVTWSVPSGKSYISLQNKSKTGVRIVAKKKGTAKVQGMIGKKKYVCTVTVKSQEVKRLKITANGQEFFANLYENATTKELVKALPMTITMKELNENEKYYYLQSKLPVNASVPSNINAGDIMLYGNDCLVFFYKSFPTSYRYTPIGTVTNPDAFAKAVGAGDVKMTIEGIIE